MQKLHGSQTHDHSVIASHLYCAITVAPPTGQILSDFAGWLRADVSMCHIKVAVVAQ